MIINYYQSPTSTWICANCYHVTDDYGNLVFIGGTKSEQLAWYFFGIERAMS